MKKNISPAFLCTLLLSLQSCAVAGGIFKAGTATGVILVVLVIVAILFIFAKLFGGKK
jgi:hypothetical protein